MSNISFRHFFTHLVDISFMENNVQNNLNSIENSCATVCISSLTKVYRIIEDVMLDISMCNTLIEGYKNFTLKEKRDFSKYKIQHIKHCKLGSENWNVNQNKNYISLAGYFWNNNEFDYLGYVKCWFALRKEIFHTEENSLKIPIETQLRKYVDFGELPLNRIKRIYQDLPEGEYVLARMYRIPKTEKMRKTLLTKFGGKKLKRGAIKILPKIKNSFFDGCLDYVKLIPIYK